MCLKKDEQEKKTSKTDSESPLRAIVITKAFYSRRAEKQYRID